MLNSETNATRVVNELISSGLLPVHEGNREFAEKCNTDKAGGGNINAARSNMSYSPYKMVSPSVTLER